MVLSLFWIILALIALLFLVTAVYFLTYRRRVNRKLAGLAVSGLPLAPPHQVLTLAGLVGLAAAVVVSYFAGYKTAYDRMEAAPAVWPETFYAEVTEVTGTAETGNSVRVQGLPINDPRYQGSFAFAVYGETALERQGDPAAFADLGKGDVVAVTFTGAPIQSDPALLAHVVRVQILKDAP